MPHCIATSADSLRLSFFLYTKRAASFWGAISCIIYPLHMTSVAVTLKPLSQVNISSAKQTFAASSTAFAWSIVRLGDTRPYVEWNDGWNPCEFHLHDVPGCTMDTKSQRMCSFALLDVRNTISPYLCHLNMLTFLLYEQWNNNFIFTRTNELECKN